MTYDVRGRTVLVTGAARGIGAAVAERMHSRGANVALVGLEPDRLEQRTKALGERAAWFEADVTDNDAVVAAVEGAAGGFGGIDIAIANAGLSFVGTLQTQPMEQWIRTIDVNLLSVYRTDRAVLPHLVERGGYLLNIASLSAIAHAPLMSAYTASKAGVEAMTDALRAELSVTRATAGCAYFGFVDTDLVRGAYEHPATRAMHMTQPTFLKRPIPLTDAVDAIDRGIARRASRLWAPRFVGSMLRLRGSVQPLAEALMTRKPEDLRAAVRLADPAMAADAPPVDPALGVAIQDGRAALEHGSAAELI
ncbi:SDR family oxidoreductase [soil metagenome]